MGRQQAKKKRRRPKPPPDRTQFEDGDSELSLFVDDAPKAPRKKRPSDKKRSGPESKKNRAPDERRDKSKSNRRKKAKARPRTKTNNNVTSGPHARNQRPAGGQKKRPTGPKTRPAEGLAYAAGVLECTKGPEEGLNLSLIEGEYTIGRAKENSFVLKDIAASRRHVQIAVRNNRVFATDMGSGNGTRVNGQRITEYELRNGDKLEIGNSVLTFRYVGKDQSQIEESVPVPAPSRSQDQERIVLAAERLAAELSERFKDEEESVPTASVPSKQPAAPPVPPLPGDANSAEGLAIDVDRSPDIAPPAAVSPPAAPRVAQDIGNAIPQQMWADHETRTRLPAGHEHPPVAAPPHSSSSVSASYEPPPSLAADPAPYVPQVQGVTAEPEERGGSGIGLMLLVFVGFTLLGGAGTAAYLWRDDIGLTEFIQAWRSTPDAAEDESSYADLMKKARDFAEAGEHESTLAWAERALAKKPGDPAAQGVVDAAQAALAEAKKAARDKPAPDPAADKEAPAPEGKAGAETDAKAADATPPPADGAVDKPAAKDPDAAPPAEPAPPPKKVAAAPPAPEKTKPAPAPKPKQVAKAKPKPKPKPKPRARSKPKPKPKPKPRPTRSAGMSDDDAKALFTKANGFFRDGDYDAACPLVKKVKAQAPGSSLWKAKAANVYKKRCE